MATGVLEFQIKRGAVDMNDIDQELKGKVQQLTELTSKKI